MSLKDLLERLLFPPFCANCGELLHYKSREALCDICRAKWEYEKADFCDICNMPQNECSCRPKLLSRGIAQVLHLAKYTTEESVCRSLVLVCKDHEYADVLGFIAKEVCALIRGRIKNPHDTVVCYLPRSKERLNKYMVDPARSVAKLVAVQLGTELVCPIKHTYSMEQKTLSSKGRLKNAKESFERIDKLSYTVKGKRVILYDDVITTGASTKACALLLKSMGAKEVSIVCLAMRF